MFIKVGLPKNDSTKLSILYSVFSLVNLIKTRTRNSLKTSTVCALLRTKDGIKTAGGCIEFVPSKNLKNRMNAAWDL